MTVERFRRLERIAETIGAINGADPARDLCRVCVQTLDVSGASLMVVTDGLASVLSSSNALAERLEGLQLTLGEGPSVDAHATGRPVAEPNLRHPRQPRWIAFAIDAERAGAGAVFSFPLRMGGIRLGALTLHQTGVGDLSDQQHIDAIGISGLATSAILVLQAEMWTAGLSPQLETLAANNAVLHQASGMASVQLGVGVGEALARLRAHAFAEDRSLAEVSDDIVAHRLTLTER